MPNTLQESMEDVSFAYMQGICAYNGYTISKVERDNDGIDATIKCKGYPAEGCLRYSPTLDIQLKASYVKLKRKKNGDLTFILETKNKKTKPENIHQKEKFSKTPPKSGKTSIS